MTAALSFISFMPGGVPDRVERRLKADPKQPRYLTQFFLRMDIPSPKWFHLPYHHYRYLHLVTHRVEGFPPQQVAQQPVSV